MARRRSAALARFWRDCRAAAAQLARVLVFHSAADPCAVGCGPGRHLRVPADRGAAFAGGRGRRIGGDHRGTGIRHPCLALGALCSWLPSKSGPQVDAALRARSAFHCADILERALARSMRGVDGRGGRCGFFHSGVTGAAGGAGDPPLLGARALDSVAAAAGVDQRVMSRLPGSRRARALMLRSIAARAGTDVTTASALRCVSKHEGATVLVLILRDARTPVRVAGTLSRARSSG
jgi:hypothetical protein